MTNPVIPQFESQFCQVDEQSTSLFMKKNLFSNVIIPSQSPINPAQSEHHASLPTYLHNSLNLMLLFNLIWLNKVTANNKRTLLHISVTIIGASVLHISHRSRSCRSQRSFGISIKSSKLAWTITVLLQFRVCCLLQFPEKWERWQRHNKNSSKPISNCCPFYGLGKWDKKLTTSWSF